MKKIDNVNGHDIKCLNDSSLLFYDHIHRIGCEINTVENWNHEPTKGRKTSRVSVDDMQMYCNMRSPECRIDDMGKRITVIIPPSHSSELPIMLCAYHSLVVFLTWRYTQAGFRISEGWHP